MHGVLLIFGIMAAIAVKSLVCVATVAVSELRRPANREKWSES